MQQRPETGHSDNGGFSPQSTLHPGMPNSQTYARSSLHFSHSPMNTMTTQQPSAEFPLAQPPPNAT